MVSLRESVSVSAGRSRVLRSSLAGLCVTWLALNTSGCAASTPEPVVVRASDFGRTSAPAGHPIVLAFKAGDRIPVVFDVTGEIVEVTPRPTTLWLTAKRDFFLRIDGSSLKTSLDGVHFGHPRAPGSFRIGLGPEPGGGTKLEVSVKTPVHAD
jgi:hypothetical protein